jgi:DNA-binding NarL/FixJ family response regulator
MERVRVTVRALDAITSAGLVNCLDSEPDLVVTAADGQVDVVVAAFDRLSTGAVAMLRATAADVRRPVVLIVNEIREVEVLPAVECRVVSILPRSAAADGRLVKAVQTAAAGGAELPPNLLGHLLNHAERLHKEVLAAHGLTASGLSPREVDVLRLMADGLDTNEIAKNLSYSERTVKNIIYTITNRLHLRNRPHAVAYAMRAGII